MPYSQEACEAVAKELGKELGNNLYAFAGDYETKGCYAYKGGYLGKSVFYGRGGTIEEMKRDLTGDIYRPPGYDCTGNILSIFVYELVAVLIS